MFNGDLLDKLCFFEILYIVMSILLLLLVQVVQKIK